MTSQAGPAAQLVYTPDTTQVRVAQHRDRRQIADLVLHLARRELDSSHRNTVLGWAWPLTRQLAQLGVLVFVFSSVLSLGIPHFAVFVFSGLVAWSWFSGGISAAGQSLLQGRHLILQPRFPAIVLPLVALAVPFVDLVLALPVLIGMTAVSGDLHATALLLPIVIVAQLLLMTGIAWLVAMATVYVRDVPQVIAVALTLVFYLTPVFYSLRSVPQHLTWILHANPLTDLIEAYRSLLVGSPFPSALATSYVLGLGAVLTFAGYRWFRRHEATVVDHL